MQNANSVHFWQSRYQDNQLPWDLGGPTPVFARLAQTGFLPPGQLMVLGAGRGHDARLFARHGFEVTAVDFATAAVEAMQQAEDPQHPVTIVHGDFFQLPSRFDGRFDYVLDYTCFCAILPRRRGEYAGLVARLLRPGGRFVSLAFPIGTRAGGPPYTVQPQAIIDLFAGHAFTLAHREAPPDSVPERRPYEELLILQK